ncbi:hypothetical protein [Parashewanella tropica]|uniref:hypothetical protein n=1 Tax=Parashewanella tropica TaxID=2547970 RepID=UPI001059C3F7|nr:hypothetical protein [Parashewanella tropica]
MSLVIRSGANFTKNLTINQKQLETIRNAQSLEEATKLGLIDRVLDKFFSRNKAEVHKQLYFLFQETAPSHAEDIINKAQAFDRLTQLVDPKHRSNLKVLVEQAPLGEQSHKVTFQFQLQDFPLSLEFSFNSLPENITPASITQQWFLAEQGTRLLRHTSCEGWQQLMEQLQLESEEVITQIYQTSPTDAETLESDEIYPDSVSEEDQSAFQDMLRANKKEPVTSELAPTDAVDDTLSSATPQKGQAHGLTPQKAVGKIEKAYRNFKQNKAAALEGARETGAKHAVMTSKDGTRYFVDPNGLFPMMRRPISRPSEQVSGASSKLDRADEQYLRFAHVDERELDKTLLDPNVDIDHYDLSRLENDFEKQEYFVEALTELQQALPNSSFNGRAIQPGMLGFMDPQGRRLAVNGGENTELFLQRTRRPIPLQAFKIACEDLASAHQHEIYFRDIKNANLVYREERTGKNGQIVPLDNPQVHFIDLEEMYTPQTGFLAKDCGTPVFMTTELAFAKSQGDKKQIEAADNYAMLLSILRASSVTLMNELPLTQTLEHGEEDMFEHGEEDMFEHGILHEQSNSAEHRAMLDQVLTQMIKPEYLEQVQRFLQEPTEYPLEESLDEVINWQASLS